MNVSRAYSRDIKLYSRVKLLVREILSPPYYRDSRGSYINYNTIKLISYISRAIVCIYKRVGYNIVLGDRASKSIVEEEVSKRLSSYS